MTLWDVKLKNYKKEDNMLKRKKTEKKFCPENFFSKKLRLTRIIIAKIILFVNPFYKKNYNYKGLNYGKTIKI